MVRMGTHHRFPVLGARIYSQGDRDAGHRAIGSDIRVAGRTGCFGERMAFRRMHKAGREVVVVAKKMTWL